MTRATPSVQQGMLITHEATSPIAIDTPAWFAWLARHHVFRFVAPESTFTARQERRAAGWYWYAYRRQRGALRSVYLGKTDQLTCVRLNEAALALCAGFLPPRHRNGTEDSAFLLATKIVRPSLHGPGVARPRLTNYVRTHSTGKMLLVVGPAGSGKTRLLCEALPTQVAWVSLDEDDNDLIRFWRYVLAALQMAYPGVALHVQTLLPSLRSPGIEPFLVPLVNAMATLPGKIVLVLDDYHLVTSQAIHASLAFLLQHAPPQLCLVVSSRVPPPLPLARLRARGELAEVVGSDLRFTRPEAEELLKLLMKRAPSVEELSYLLEYTQGWVTGLYLASLTGREGRVKTASPVGSSPDHRALFEYLASEVLADQPEQVRAFLLCSSILESFCADLCDAVMLQDSGQTLLRQLDHTHFFLAPLDDSHIWYRYHPLFADFLRSRLREASKEQVKLLHRRAADWYARNEMPAEAIAHALYGDDVALAGRLIEERGRSVLMHHEIVTLQSWLSALPEGVVYTFPRLCLLAAWTQMHTSQMGPVEEYLCAAEHCLAGGEYSADERETLAGEIAAIRARAAVYQGNGQHSIVLARQALRVLDTDDYYVRGEVALSMGTANAVLGDLDAAEAAYREAIELSWRCGNLRSALLTVRSLGLLYLDLGCLSQAAKVYKDALQLVLEQGQEQLPPVGFLYIGLGELSYEWNDLEAAERYLREGIALGRRGGDVKIWLLGYLKLVFTALARGDGERSWQLLAEAEHLARQANFARGVTWVEEERARLNAMHGNFAPLLTWLQEQGLSPQEELDGQYEEVTWHHMAQALIARHEPDHALHILRRLHAGAEQAHTVRLRIPVLLTMAQAYQLRGDFAEALEALSQALTLGEPQGYMRTFVDEGAALVSLLSALRAPTRQPSSSYSTAYLTRLLKAFHADPLIQQHQPKDDHLLTEGLSRRELEVLRLLATGCSNAKIAEILIIGVNTVKSHLKNIYAKLEVSSRTQAIARARNLQLL